MYQIMHVFFMQMSWNKTREKDVQGACRASSAFMCFHDNYLSLAAILVICNANQSAWSFLCQVFFMQSTKERTL